MNIATYSPALVLLYVGLLLWILMDVHYMELPPRQRWLVPLLLLLLAGFNHFLRLHLGAAVYGQMIFFTMHLPYFLVFLYLTKCGIVKMAFMIFSAVVFTAPTIVIGNFVKRILSGDTGWELLLANLITYGIMILFAQFGLRKGFNYMVKYGEERFFLRFSVIPFLYYVYLFAVMNLDFSVLHGTGWYVMRLLPTIFVLSFYFLLPNIYKELSEKREVDMAAAVLTQELHAAETQILRLNETQIQTAIYQHDMRHHLTAIDGFLSAGKTQRAKEYIQEVQEDVAGITLKRFCENELVNLLCSSFVDKAGKMGIRLSVTAKLPKHSPISDTELCAVLSNGLENAMHAVSHLEGQKWAELYCEVKWNKLLIEIKNPYFGEILMQDGLPVSSKEKHGYGCYSIRAITERYQGICTFETENGIFILRVMLPIQDIKA